METIGRYQIVAEIGRGGGGVVYKATDPESNEIVAVKTVPASDSFGTAARQMLVQRLRREAQSAASLLHPNIVRVRELAEDGVRVYFVMEYVEGATLEDRLRVNEKLSQQEALSILEQTASALDYAHQQGIVHRDIKPANIMITGDGQVKITDFGTAKQLSAGAATQLTVAGTMLGSPHYMSPEQVTESGVDGRSDQFSLGVIAYEIFTGRKPFEGDFAPSVLYQIVSEPAPAVETIRPDLPPALNSVLQRALGKKRLERYPCCCDFVRALSEVLAQNQSRGASPSDARAGESRAGVASQQAVPEPPRRPWWKRAWNRLRFRPREN